MSASRIRPGTHGVYEACPPTAALIHPAHVAAPQMP
jgi:hypothetical protein